jgi:chromosome segregation ATPase
MYRTCSGRQLDEQESRDVEQIQKGSFSSFLLKLVGKYEDKLEKEQRDEINAKLAYDRAAEHLEYLVREKDELASRISALRADEKTYQAELADRRIKLKLDDDKAAGIRYEELENERKAIVSQITEIEEALRAAARAKSTAHKISKSLDSAEGWATWDMFTRGGIITHIAKYSHIDDAEKNFSVLSSQLRDLKTELGDVRGLTASGLSGISSTQRGIDFWFDNIFTDLSVRSQIKDNIEQIRTLLGNISKTETALEAKLKEQEKEFEKNKKAEEDFLLSIN